MIGFGKKKTLIFFINKYREYGGDMEGEKRGLIVGGFKYAWLADLVAAFILKTIESLFSVSFTTVSIKTTDLSL